MGTWLKRIGLGALALVVLCTVAVFAVDAHVRSSAGPRIVSVDEAAALGDVDCARITPVRKNRLPSSRKFSTA